MSLKFPKLSRITEVQLALGDWALGRFKPAFQKGYMHSFGSVGNGIMSVFGAMKDEYVEETTDTGFVREVKAGLWSAAGVATALSMGLPEIIDKISEHGARGPQAAFAKTAELMIELPGYQIPKAIGIGIGQTVLNWEYLPPGERGSAVGQISATFAAVLFGLSRVGKGVGTMMNGMQPVPVLIPSASGAAIMGATIPRAAGLGTLASGAVLMAASGPGGPGTPPPDDMAELIKGTANGKPNDEAKLMAWLERDPERVMKALKDNQEQVGIIKFFVILNLFARTTLKSPELMTFWLKRLESDSPFDQQVLESVLPTIERNRPGSLMPQLEPYLNLNNPEGSGLGNATSIVSKLNADIQTAFVARLAKLSTEGPDKRSYMIYALHLMEKAQESAVPEMVRAALLDNLADIQSEARAHLLNDLPFNPGKYNRLKDTIQPYLTHSNSTVRTAAAEMLRDVEHQWNVLKIHEMFNIYGDGLIDMRAFSETMKMIDEKYHYGIAESIVGHFEHYKDPTVFAEAMSQLGPNQQVRAIVQLLELGRRDASKRALIATLLPKLSSAAPAPTARMLAEEYLCLELDPAVREAAGSALIEVALSARETIALVIRLYGETLDAEPEAVWEIGPVVGRVLRELKVKKAVEAFALDGSPKN